MIIDRVGAVGVVLTESNEPVLTGGDQIIGFRSLEYEIYRGAFPVKKGLVDARTGWVWQTRRRLLLFDNAWVDLADGVTTNPAWCVVGNKADIRDKAAFGEDELARLAGSLGSPHMLTSARTGENVERAFQALTRSVFVGMRRSGLASLP